MAIFIFILIAFLIFFPELILLALVGIFGFLYIALEFILRLFGKTFDNNDEDSKRK